MSGTNTSNFKFVLIPADDGAAIEEREESKSGGLTEDKLIQHARTYFGPEHICDIAALTIPTATNKYTAVSLYHTGEGPQNQRATQLVVGCGMSNMNICGDAFVGRCIDNEVDDIWERIDFTISDTDPASEWCKVARASTAGSSRQGQASSLSGILKQQFNAAASKQQEYLPEATPVINNNFGANGVSVVEEWGSWTQTDDEIELKFVVPPDTQAKHVKVQFSRTKLAVTVRGQELLTAGNTLFDPVIPDECTYTIQTETNNTRELCVTLTKANTGITWSYAAK